MQRLQSLFSSSTSCPDNQTLCFVDSDPVSWQKFQLRVSDWQVSLMQCQAQSIALYFTDSLEFSAALFALWRCGKVAIIPSSAGSDTVSNLQKITDVFVGDFDGVESLRPVAASSSACDMIEPDDSQCALVVFTSGSSGEPSPIAKSFSQLNTELFALEKLWGEFARDSVVTGTVSHQHLYGLLFKLLWPLTAGRPFVHKQRGYWEELFDDAKSFSKLSVVCSPAHLDRMPPEEPNRESWQVLRDNASVCFSSGAPLHLDSATLAQQKLGREVIEIFGSSETGAVAWRVQREDVYWQPLPQVLVELRGGQLAIKGPGLPDDEWFVSADRCKFESSQRFLLLGRSDRIVKIEGVRISLTAIEKNLLAHSWVETCRVLSLKEHGDRVGAVICLSKEGRQALVDRDKRSVNTELLSVLQQVDRIALPRYWRYINHLPINAQGKTTHTMLSDLFSKQVVRFANVVKQSRSEEGGAQLALHIPMNLYYFKGHFPGSPILPGVVQTHWAVHYGRELFGDLGVFSHLEVIKFQNVIEADQQVTLKLSYSPEKSKLTFSYCSENQQHSSGRVVFQQESV